MPQCDIVIVGGGLVGAALARSLALHRISSIVIDNQPETALYSSELDNRGLALSYASRNILEKIQVWDDLQTNAVPIKSIHVSEQGAFGFTKLSLSKTNLPAFGYVISASKLGRALIHGLDQNENITVMRPVNIDTFVYDASAKLWQIHVNSQIITAKLIVAADGTDSLLRQFTNSAITTKNYHQSAIVCNIVTQELVKNRAYERFTSQGVLALLPFGDKQFKCVLTVANTKLDALQQMSDAEYLAFVQKLIGSKVGKLQAVQDRKIFPIRHLMTHQLVAPGVVYIGNAANTLHPVAAQGFNLGLRDVQQLTELLSSRVITLPINSIEFLQQYAQLRTEDHIVTHKFTNTLVEIFESNFTLLQNARRLGLLTAQIVPGIKQYIIAQGERGCD